MSNVPKALEIVNEIKKNRRHSEAENKIMVNGKTFERTLAECPKCDSDMVFQEKYSFFKSLFYNFFKRNHYCQNCKYSWKQYL